MRNPFTKDTFQTDGKPVKIEQIDTSHMKVTETNLADEEAALAAAIAKRVAERENGDGK